jgi:alanine racemase
MQHNLAVARKCAPPSKVWAVVKANAYGHGLARGMHAFADADGLALIEIEGAVKLREMGWQKPVLLLEGFFDTRDLTAVAAHELQVAVHCDEQIEMLARSQIVKPVDVHLKMNSGMNRLGFTPAIYHRAHARLRAIPFVRNIALMTHFANADDPLNAGLPLSEQAKCFQDTVSNLVGERSLSNSAAILSHPQFAADWVRPGIMLYGGTPDNTAAQQHGLKPAMTLASEIIGVQQIGAGDAVGYGSRFIADRPMTIGVVACGYADGYPRHAPNGTPVLVDGIRTALIGRVSMDMLAVDLTGIPGAHVGSTVTLWGDSLPIDEVAHAAGTIGYELMCALTPRVRVIER